MLAKTESGSGRRGRRALLNKQESIRRKTPQKENGRRDPRSLGLEEKKGEKRGASWEAICVRRESAAIPEGLAAEKAP